AAHVDVGADDAFAGVPAGLFGRGRHTALAEQRDRLVEVAVGLLERALAVHHARAGSLAELLDGVGRDCHGRVAPVSLAYGVRTRRAPSVFVVEAWRTACGRSVEPDQSAGASS